MKIVLVLLVLVAVATARHANNKVKKLHYCNEINIASYILN